MTSAQNTAQTGIAVRRWLADIPVYLLRPVTILRSYSLANLPPDLIAGLTIAIILLPQGLAYALVAELPPQMGLYAAIGASAFGALWGSSSHLQTGPTNPSALLVLSVLLTVAAPGSPEYLMAAGLMAVMVGMFKVVMGVARLGVLVNFVSDAVIVGFTAGAGLLIAINQLRHIFGVSVVSSSLVYETLWGTLLALPDMHLPTVAIGAGALVLILAMKRFTPKLPNYLIATILSAVPVFALGLGDAGVVVVGRLPQTLPPIASIDFFDLQTIGLLSNGALAAAAIGLVEAVAIGRSIAAQTGEHLDSNQEFVGQGMACIAAGLLSGYTVSGSYTRSAVAIEAGGKTALTHVFVSVFVLLFMLLIAPLTAYLPIAGVAAVVIVSAFGLFDTREMRRIANTSLGDTLVMIVTLVATLLLPLQFAVLVGVLASFGRFLLRTSTPLVYPVVPDDSFRHFVRESDESPACVQVGLMAVEGPLYFGAVHHVEEAIREYMDRHPEQHYLVLRMHMIDHMDVSGVHMLESVARLYHQKGGELFLVGMRPQVLEVIRASGLEDQLADNLLDRSTAVSYLFHNVLDPGICIYECPFRVFAECQALPKYNIGDVPAHWVDVSRVEPLHEFTAHEMQAGINSNVDAVVLDVREPGEYAMGHITGARLLPLREIVNAGDDELAIPHDAPVFVVCRAGRRSTHAINILRERGFDDLRHLKGGMLAWEAAGLPIAVE